MNQNNIIKSTQKTIRCRIAPSPTGVLHIGTARTALFNYLFAKHYNGAFILRIEDTDIERSDKKYEKDIIDGLRWFGIKPDEGPEEGGLYGPYRQSERLATYKTYIEKLLQNGRAFYCFHSEEELDAEKKKQLESKIPTCHICEWRNLSPEEAEKKREAAKTSIIRFKILDEGNPQIVFDDSIRGQVHFFIRLLGDFSIAKDMNTPLYNFAVVVDDYEMKISHVIRGEDHISNTPKQILLQEALGFPRPEYAHLPLILGSDRSKLSKRHGATSVNEYREAGYLAEALANFMALLGWNPGDEREIFSLEELANEFSLERVQISGAVFNLEKLDSVNARYIRKKSIKDLAELSMPYLQKNIPNLSSFSSEYIEKVLVLEQSRLKKLSELPERVRFFFSEPGYEKELLRWKDMSDEDIKQSLERSQKIVGSFSDNVSRLTIEQAFLNEIGKEDKGKILWPLRVALSGQKTSPGPFEIIEVLGREQALSRLKFALPLLQ